MVDSRMLFIKRAEKEQRDGRRNTFYMTTTASERGTQRETVFLNVMI
jgi:hypothetical protein